MAMDSGDLLRVAVPVLSFAIGVASLLYFWPRPAKIVLDRTRKRLRLLDVRELAPDTKLFRLSLGSKDATLGLPVGKHMVLFAPNPPSCLTSGKWNGRDDPDRGQQEIERKYTPVTGDDTKGYVDLVIKMYRPGKFRMPDGKEVDWADGGKMGLHLDKLRPGDSVELKGPFGVNQYLGRGMFKLPGRTLDNVKCVGMLAGGTGLTPMLQVVRAGIRDAGDRTVFSLLYANKTEEDILVKEQLEDLAATSNGRFKLHYTLDFPPAGWKGKKGFVTAAMIRECLPAPDINTLVLICGPPPFVDFACKPNLEALGYAKESVAVF